MNDLSTQTILITTVVGLARAVEWLAKALIARPRNGTNGKHVTGVQSGQLTPDEWEGRMRKLHEDSEERLMRDMRSLLATRNEEFRRIIREEMK